MVSLHAQSSPKLDTILGGGKKKGKRKRLTLDGFSHRLPSYTNERCYPLKIKIAGWEFLKELERIGNKHVGCCYHMSK